MSYILDKETTKALIDVIIRLLTDHIFENKKKVTEIRRISNNSDDNLQYKSSSYDSDSSNDYSSNL